MKAARVLGADDDGRAFVKWTSGNTSWVGMKMGSKVDKGRFPSAFRPSKQDREEEGFPERGDIVLGFPDEVTLWLSEATARAAQHALAVALGSGVSGPTIAEQIWAEAVRAYEEMSQLEKGSSAQLAQGRAQGLSLALAVLLGRTELSIRKEVKERSKHAR